MNELLNCFPTDEMKLGNPPPNTFLPDPLNLRLMKADRISPLIPNKPV